MSNFVGISLTIAKMLVTVHTPTEKWLQFTPTAARVGKGFAPLADSLRSYAGFAKALAHPYHNPWLIATNIAKGV